MPLHLPDTAALSPGWLVLALLLGVVVVATRLPVVGGCCAGW
jgi:hypothetical protein